MPSDYGKTAIDATRMPAKGGGLEKLDKRRLHGEVTTFARCVAALDKMTVAEIKGANG